MKKGFFLQLQHVFIMLYLTRADIICIQPKKKKDKIQIKQIKASTDTEFGVLNVCVSGYDMTLVEHYSQYIHNFCNHLDINVVERWDFFHRCNCMVLWIMRKEVNYVIWIIKLCPAYEKHRGHGDAGPRHQDVCRWDSENIWTCCSGRVYYHYIISSLYCRWHIDWWHFMLLFR